MRAALLLLAAGLILPGPLSAGVSEIRLDPSPEHRLKLALENAEQALARAKTEYFAGQPDACKGSVQEVLDSVELARDALDATHRNPLRSPRWFKYAEQRSTELLRRMRDFEHAMDAADRPLVEPAYSRIQEIHDAWLTGILSKKH